MPVYDDFNRSDTSDITSGSSWSTQQNVVGISSNRAYGVNSTLFNAVFQDGAAAGEISIQIYNYASGSRPGLIIRGVDASNFIRIWINNSNQIRVDVVTSGTPVVEGVTPGTYTVIDGDRLSVRFDATGFQVKFNGSTVLTSTSTAHATGIKVGFLIGGVNATRLDNFVFNEQPLAVAVGLASSTSAGLDPELSVPESLPVDLAAAAATVLDPSISFSALSFEVGLAEFDAVAIDPVVTLDGLAIGVDLAPLEIVAFDPVFTTPGFLLPPIAAHLVAALSPAFAGSGTLSVPAGLAQIAAGALAPTIALTGTLVIPIPDTPRLVSRPLALQALTGPPPSTVGEFVGTDWLVEWDWPGETHYYSRFERHTLNGNLYRNRILSLGTIELPYIDHKKADFGEVSVEFSNLAEDGSSDFEFTVLDGVDDFEDKELRIYRYDATSGQKTLVWRGISKRPTFDPANFTCTISATYIWDAVDIKVPRRLMQHGCPNRFGGSSYETNGFTVLDPGCPYSEFGTPGFTSCDKTLEACTERGMERFFAGWTRITTTLQGEPNNTVDRKDVRKQSVPILIGSGDLKIRAEVFRSVVKGEELIVNAVVSGCHPGLPFGADDLIAKNVKLGNIRASWVRWKPGEFPADVPGNRTVWPEKAGHSGVAMFAAGFRMTKEELDKYRDDTPLYTINVKLPGGRKILRSGGRTDSPVYALEDIFRDQLYGLGLPSSEIDNARVVAAANYVGTRFHGRFEWDSQEALIDFTQRMLAQFGGFITMPEGKLAIGVKRDDETPVATFGAGGYTIIDNEVTSTEADFSELTNELNITWRSKLRQRRERTFYDAGAQIKAGNGTEKVVSEDLFLYHFDDDEALIAAAIWLREELNLNLEIEFSVPLDDWFESGVEPGDVVRVNSVHIFENATNYLFRVESPAIDTEAFLVRVRATAYRQVVYAYNADIIGSDILRDGGETPSSGRPPDVTNVAAVGLGVYEDDDGLQERIHCTWEYPDISAEMGEDEMEGFSPEIPWEAVKLVWRYTDEGLQDLKLGSRVEYPATEADFQVPFHKDRDVEVWFVAVGRNNGQGAVGYVPDSSRVSYIDEDLDDSDEVIDVDDTAPFVAGDLVRIEDEFLRIAAGGVGAGTITVEAAGGARTPELGSEAVDHPEGTQIAVAVQSHPTAVVDLSPRRYTLPIVENVRTRSRNRGLRVRWDDINQDAPERYLIYVAVGNDALDAGSTIVSTWGSYDPLAPEAVDARVRLYKARDLDKLIPWEDLDELYGDDAAGVEVSVRISARRNKRFSSALSALGNENSGHHNRPVGPPSTPTSAEIRFDDIPGSNKVRCTFTIGSSENARPLDEAGDPTFAERDMQIVGAVLQKWNKQAAAWGAEHFERPDTEIEDPETQKTAEVSIELHRGSKWRWVRNFAKNRGSRRQKSPDANVVFTVGEKVDDISTITDLAIAPFGSNELTNSIELDARHSQLLITFTQPADPVALLRLQIRKKKDAATRWNRESPLDLAHEEDDEDQDLETTGLKKLRHTVQHPKNQAMDYRVRLVAADGTKTAWVTLDASSSDETSGISDTAGPSWSVTPAATVKFNKKGLVGKVTLPDQQNKTIFRYEYEFTNTAGNQWMREDGTASTSSYTFFDAGNRVVLNLAKSEVASPFQANLRLRVRPWNHANGIETAGAWSNYGSTGALPSDQDPAPNPAAAAAAPTFKKATVGNGGLTARFDKPADARPYLQYYEFQFADSSSVTTSIPRDWLNAETGAIALVATAPSVGDAALAAATFRGSTAGRFHAGDVRRRDLDYTFTSGVRHGALTLFARARVVDLDDAGALRPGTWSGWNAVVHRASVDRDQDVPVYNTNAGLMPYIEGMSCAVAANGFPNPAGTSEELGKKIQYAPGGSGGRVATFASLYGSGNPYDVGRENIYWDKDNRAIVVYGRAGGKSIFIKLFGALIPGEVYWWTWAMRASIAGFTFPGTPPFQGYVSGIYDQNLGGLRAGYFVNPVLSATGTNYKIFAQKLTVETAFTGNAWMYLSFIDWFTGADPTRRIWLTHGYLSKGPRPQLWNPGSEERLADVAPGVFLGDVGGLAALESGGGAGSDGISTFGELDL